MIVLPVSLPLSQVPPPPDDGGGVVAYKVEVSQPLHHLPQQYCRPLY